MKHSKEDTINLNEIEYNFYTPSVKTIYQYALNNTSEKDREALQIAVTKTLLYLSETNPSYLFWKTHATNLDEVIIMNQDKNKALVFITTIKATKHGTSKMVAASKQEDGSWLVSTKGLPNFTYEYDEKQRKGQLFTEREILFHNLQKLADDGLVLFEQVNQEYINTKWF
ncbi:MAG: hypothetical protein H6553_00790 [Chitinophagales bacterium]|nr:hypothetical protein [Chitinophagales bacterium]